MKRVHVLFLMLLALALIAGVNNIRRNVIPNVQGESPQSALALEVPGEVKAIIQSIMRNEIQLTEDVHRDFWLLLDSISENEEEASRYASRLSSTLVFAEEYQLELFRSAKLSEQNQRTLKTSRFQLLVKQFEESSPGVMARADDFLESAANQTPMTGSDGNPVIITKDLIEQGLLALEASFGRLRQLLNREWRTESNGREL